MDQEHRGVKRTPLKRKTPLKAKTGFKRHTWTRKPLKPLQRQPVLRARSTKRARQEQKYNARVREIIADMNAREIPCPVVRDYGNINDFWRYQAVTQCHHMAGREGDLLLAEEHWLFVSDKGHNWIHSHPNEARAAGWIYEAIKVNGKYIKTGSR